MLVDEEAVQMAKLLDSFHWQPPPPKPFYVRLCTAPQICWYFARSNGYWLFVMVSLLITILVT
jgi:hypothetical protein